MGSSKEYCGRYFGSIGKSEAFLTPLSKTAQSVGSFLLSNSVAYLEAERRVVLLTAIVFLSCMFLLASSWIFNKGYGRVAHSPKETSQGYMEQGFRPNCGSKR